MNDHDPPHDHNHIHDHDHDHAPPSDDPSPGAHGILEQAIRELLIEKGVLTAAGVQREIERMEAMDGSRGAEIVSTAWTDPAFRSRLLADARGALGELDIDIGQASDLAVVENTDSVHHLVVCTLCSCYPRSLLGRPPSWYKSREYRARAVREPRTVLAEFGLELPEGMHLRVVDSTADLRYMVLPRRPPGTEAWSRADLAGLVTRDTLIGVACPGVDGTRRLGKPS